MLISPEAVYCNQKEREGTNSLRPGSCDGARTWTTIAPGRTLKELLQNGEQITALDFITDKTGWVLLSSADNQATQLVRTTDGG
jgi:hypothetical protein